jgi:hypothetical protein
LNIGIIVMEMRHHILHYRFHFLQVGKNLFHFVIEDDAERVNSEILEVANRFGVAEVAAKEDAITVLELHQLLLEIGGIEVEEHIFVAVKFEVIRLGLDVELGFIGRRFLLAGGHDEDETD